ncbi:hypothetical protein M6D81_29525 [Paenibacillus sp. J5C_2022]|nr:hypothetical protein [Paenibacillus sp. J5C2022]
MITCSSKEELVSEAGSCALRTECDNTETCTAWGDQIAEELAVRYGSFVEMEPVEMSEEDEERSEEDEEIIAEYETEGNDFVGSKESTDAAGHERLWNDFTWLFPLEEREMVTAFSVFSHVDTLAHVSQNEDNVQEWSLGMNIDPGIMTPEEKVATLVHEFGHLLALNSDQVDPLEEERSCTTLFLDEGCVSKDAYILEFYATFWPEPEYDYDEKQFVSEYAATDFVEDMAESWMNFVLTEKPAGTTIAEKKVLFFYEYDELVRLRADLLARVASWMERHVA